MDFICLLYAIGHELFIFGYAYPLILIAYLRVNYVWGLLAVFFSFEILYVIAIV